MKYDIIQYLFQVTTQSKMIS